jgi:glucan phosphorylase
MKQIVDGWQVEKTDKWLSHGNPWEIVRSEWSVEVMFGGTVEHRADAHGRTRAQAPRWTGMSILNTARSGKFSSDRIMREYCTDLWKAAPVTIEVAANGNNPRP